MRHYMPELGIFLSRDTLPYRNKYRAFGNNPVGQVDRDGLAEEGEDGPPRPGEVPAMTEEQMKEFLKRQEERKKKRETEGIAEAAATEVDQTKSGKLAETIPELKVSVIIECSPNQEEWSITTSNLEVTAKVAFLNLERIKEKIRRARIQENLPELDPDQLDRLARDERSEAVRVEQENAKAVIKAGQTANTEFDPKFKALKTTTEVGLRLETSELADKWAEKIADESFEQKVKDTKAATGVDLEKNKEAARAAWSQSLRNSIILNIKRKGE